MGVGWGSGPLGAATRCPRRRRPFHFFSRLGLFWRFGKLALWASGRTTTNEIGLPPNPYSKNRKSTKFYRHFIWRFLKMSRNHRKPQLPPRCVGRGPWVKTRSVAPMGASGERSTTKSPSDASALHPGKSRTPAAGADEIRRRALQGETVARVLKGPHVHPAFPNLVGVCCTRRGALSRNCVT